MLQWKCNSCPGWGWWVVAASFMIHIIADGVAYTFGLFFVYIAKDFNESKSATSWITSIMAGMTYGSGEFMIFDALYKKNVFRFQHKNIISTFSFHNCLINKYYEFVCIAPHCLQTNVFCWKRNHTKLIFINFYAICVFFMNILGPVAGALVNKFGCRITSIVGSFVAAFGFSISYYAQSVTFLYISIGLIGGECNIFI